MIIYIITKQSFPNGMAGTNRILCYAKAIISQGISCKVLIFTRTEIHSKKPRNIEGKGRFDGIDFEYVGGTPIRSSNLFIRRANDVLDKIRLKKYLSKNLTEDDVVFGFCSEVNFINSIIKIVHNKKAKYVKELCELPFGTGKETIESIKQRDSVLKSQYPLCDGIIAISDSLVELAKQYASKKCHVIKVPILVDFDKYYLEDFSSKAEIPYIFHSGTLYEQKDGILGMLEAFGKACSQIEIPIKFISTGNIINSPHKDQIKQIIQQYHLEDKVLFTGYLSKEQLKDYLSKASLTIINKYPNQQNTYCFSTKLGEYLAAGKPVIITKVGEAMNWLKDGDSAFIIEPNDTDLLAKTIVEAFNDSEKRERISRNGQNVCRESFDYIQYGNRLKLFFSELTQ